MNNMYQFLLCLTLPTILSGATPGQRVWNILNNSEPIAESAEDTIASLTPTVVAFAKLNTIKQKVEDDLATVESLSLIEIIQDESLIEEIDQKLQTSLSNIDAASIRAISSCLGTAITQDDFSTGTFTINSSGRYYFAQNINASPTSGNFALNINANNVYLDLNGHTLMQANAQSLIDGIQTGTSTNITIANGRVSGFTRRGISCSGDNTHLINIISESNSDHGILLSSLNNFSIKKCRAYDNGDGGIILDANVNRGIISNCEAINNNSNSSSGGIYLQNSNDIHIQNCCTNNNGGSNAAGIRMQQCRRVIINNCSSSSNGLAGIYWDDRINQCYVFNSFFSNNAEFGLTGNAGINNNTTAGSGIYDCLFTSNRGTGSGNAGIDLSAGSGQMVRNNFIIHNQCVYNIDRNITTTITLDSRNTILANFAFNALDQNNYPSPESVVEVETTNFSSNPAYWLNISMTP